MNAVNRPPRGAVGRTALAVGLTARYLIAGIIFDGIGISKAHLRLLVREAAKLPDLRHQLRSYGLADIDHLHNGFIFRKLGGQTIHLGTIGFHYAGNGVELGNSFLQQLAGISRNFCRVSMCSSMSLRSEKL